MKEKLDYEKIKSEYDILNKEYQSIINKRQEQLDILRDKIIEIDPGYINNHYNIDFTCDYCNFYKFVIENVNSRLVIRLVIDYNEDHINPVNFRESDFKRFMIILSEIISKLKWEKDNSESIELLENIKRLKVDLEYLKEID